MSLVSFIHRTSKPGSPVPGSFYWIDTDDVPQIWFAPTDVQDEMILLNDKEIGGDKFEELVSRVDTTESEIDNIINIIIDDELVIAAALNDLNSRLVNVEEGNIDVELTDSDYDKIAEKVNERMLTLTWKAI